MMKISMRLSPLWLLAVMGILSATGVWAGTSQDTPTPTQTRTPTNTPTPTSTPKTTPPTGLWQDQWDTTGIEDDLDAPLDPEDYINVYWPRHIGDHFGHIIRKSLNPQSTPVFLPYPTQPDIRLYDTAGAEQTPVPWETPTDRFWGFQIPEGDQLPDDQLYWQVDALSNVSCYDFSGTGFGVPYTVAAYTSASPDYNTFSGITVEALIKTDSTADRQTIVWIFSSGTSVAVNLELRYVTDHLELAGMFRESGGTTKVLSGGTILTGQWYHVALVWTGSVVTLYVDGASVHSANSTGPIYDADSYYTRIGAYGSSYYGFDGRIDEVRISSVAHDPGEFVLRGPAKAEAGTEFLFHFSGGSSSLVDSSGNGRNMSFSYYSCQEWISNDGFGEVAGSVDDFAIPPTPIWKGGLEFPTATATPNPNCLPWSDGLSYE